MNIYDYIFFHFYVFSKKLGMDWAAPALMSFVQLFMLFIFFSLVLKNDINEIIVVCTSPFFILNFYRYFNVNDDSHPIVYKFRNLKKMKLRTIITGTIIMLCLIISFLISKSYIPSPN